MAVFLSVVQTTHTPPHDALFTFLCPCASAAECSALAADQSLREGIFAGVGSEAGGSFLRGASGCASPCHFGLHLIELITVDDAVVVVFDEVHGKLTCVLDGLAADEVLAEGLLHQNIAAVLFVLQDTADAGDRPFRRVLEAWDLICFFGDMETVSILNPSNSAGLEAGSIQILCQMTGL